MSYPFWITLGAILALALVYVVVPVAGYVFARYRRARTVRCPETGTEARVQVDAAHAALSAVPGPPDLRVVDCSQWPERSGCERTCTPQL
jgi:hypothetical protein